MKPLQTVHAFITLMLFFGLMNTATRLEQLSKSLKKQEAKIEGSIRLNERAIETLTKLVK